jgi:transcriptional regulator with XRE-family HTH domain
MKGKSMPRLKTAWTSGSHQTPSNVDRHVGARMRERRIMLGLSQAELAKLLGVTYQQAHKYEAGINRISAGRLHLIAQALGVGIEYFFVGLEQGRASAKSPQQRLLLELTRNFMQIPDSRHKEALCALARALTTFEAEADPEQPDAQEHP